VGKPEESKERKVLGRARVVWLLADGGGRLCTATLQTNSNEKGERRGLHREEIVGETGGGEAKHCRINFTGGSQ